MQLLENAAPKPVQLVRENALADMLGISAGSLAKWRVQGRGPKWIKLGRAVAYDMRDVRAWLEANGRTSTSESTTLTAA